MISDYSLSDEFYRRLNERIADSLQGFWDLVAMAGVRGVLGDRGRAGAMTSSSHRAPGRRRMREYLPMILIELFV